MTILRAFLGVAFFCLVAWGLSRDRGLFPWRILAWGVGLQAALGGLILGTSFGRTVFQGIADFFVKLIGMTDPGAQLVFGPLADSRALEAAFGTGAGFVFAFAGKGLLALLFLAALTAILYHLGIMQVVIWALARVMSKLMGVSGAESMAMAANVFVGPTEAPLAIRPYIAGMTRSELNALMTGGFATIAGTVLALYMGFVGEDLAPHLLTASVMSAPAAFVIAKILVPESETAATAGRIDLKIERTATNVIEAATNGTLVGVKLALNIAAMLVAFMALVNLVNWPLGAFGDAIGLEGGLSLSRIFGWVLAPVAWLIGIDGWRDSQLVGGLLGTKVAVNELIAYAELGRITGPDGGGFSNDRSAIIATYALCGFANFGTIGIQIGGLAALAPERKQDLSRLAIRAMLGGAFASWMTAAIAGIFV